MAAWLARRAPAGLLRRVRWLFLVFLLAVLAILLLGLPQDPEPGWPHNTIAAASTVLWGLWALYRYRRPDAPLITDIVPVLALVVTGTTTGTPLAVFGPAFVTIYFRAMFGTRRQALANAALLAGGFFLVVGYHDGVGEVTTIGSGLLLVAFLAVGLVMQALGRAAGQHERTTERERVLADAAAGLLRAQTEAEVQHAALEGAARMVPDSRTTASLWRFGDDGALELTATAGAEVSDVRAVPSERMPAGILDALDAGEPFLLDAVATRELERAYGQPAVFHNILIVPLVADDRREGALALASTAELDEGLPEVMHRFAHEVLLGLERSRLLAELQQTNADLRRADEVKDQFLSTVSHELRTPLTSIRGFAQTLRRAWPQLSDERREKCLDIIERQAQRQQLLVDDLLATSQIMAGRLRVEPSEVEVASVVVAVLEELSVPDGEHRLVGDPGLRIRTDPLHLHQALSNLLSNAVKYGRPPYEVHLTRDGAWCAVQVRDHGPGVPEPYRDELYEPFSRGSRGGNGAAGGVGLGLTIVRRLAIVNGGSVDYRADVSPGACFELRLPVGVAEEPQEPSGAAEAG